VYRSGWRQYIRFCQAHRYSPLPLSEHTLCQFAAVMSQTVTWKTIRIYLSALRFFQIRAGLPDPSLSSFPRLTYVLRGIHRLTPDRQRRHRLPITMHLLRALHRIWSTPPVLYNHVMLWAACCLGFFGVLRAGEFTCTTADTTDPPLSPSDIAVDTRDNPQLVVVHLRRTKTDPFGVGCRVYLGRTNTTPCPVAAILNYLSIRPATSGPLFLLESGAPLTRAALVTHLRTALAQAGVAASSYSGHSFRIGAATAAAQAGYSDSFIQSLGRWRSAAFIAYIRTSTEELAAVAPTLVHCAR
jgi:hypothetical protein